MLEIITPEWDAPPQVHAYTTTRLGGCSQIPYAGLNLAEHVGDAPQAVAANRNQLAQWLKLPSEPLWLQQVHGTQVVEASAIYRGHCADAAYTTENKTICVVLTADCLPVLLCDQAGTCVAAAHAGWRGLAAGILEATLQHFYDNHIATHHIMAWLGPAISGQAFEVGDEVRDEFMRFLPQATVAFTATRPGHWLADLYLLARQRLMQQGLTAIYGGNFCTYQDARRFYSYRRDKVTGRMASLIWLEKNDDS